MEGRFLEPRQTAVTTEVRVHMDSPDAEAVLANGILRFAVPDIHEVKQLVVLCIGSDRSIGDSLGPLVGTYLTERSDRSFRVSGTLDSPVHASNLCDTLDWLKLTYPKSFIIAVDACLGRLESVGVLTVGKGSLRPGAGVNKSLPPVGQMYITGVVNVGGFMEYFVLQNTRLSLVVRMAKILARGIEQGLTGWASPQHATLVSTGPSLPFGRALLGDT